METNSIQQPTLNYSTEFEEAKDLLAEKVRQISNINKSNGSSGVFRVEQKISHVDPLKWLQQQKNPIKIYWSERDHEFETAGIGFADRITGDNEIDYGAIFKKMKDGLNPTYENLRYFGGFSFNNKWQDSDWQNFGVYNFLIPQIEVFREGKETKIAFNFKLNQIENANLKCLDKINYHPDIHFDTSPVLQARSDIPDKNEWVQNIKFAKQLFRERKIEKIVLARKSNLEFSRKLIPELLLAQLKKVSPTSFHFYFQPTEDVGFLGASPELLYRRENAKICSEAVAGTRPRGDTDEEDVKLAKHLLNSSKDIYEHDLVCQFIEMGMKQLCHSMEMDNRVSILRSENVQHLYKKFWGILKEHIGDPDIISILHPTPAIGGVPKEISFQEIREIEKFDRGWYAGPIGWVSTDSAEFAVGIRSGLIIRDNLHLFSGSGIVPDSDPELEWQEIEQKISHFMKLFQA